MNGIGCMHEHGRSTGWIEGGHNFLRDSALANAGNHHAAFRIVNKLYGISKTIIDTLQQSAYRIRLNAERGFSYTFYFVGRFQSFAEIL